MMTTTTTMIMMMMVQQHAHWIQHNNHDGSWYSFSLQAHLEGLSQFAIGPGLEFQQGMTITSMGC